MVLGALLVAFPQATEWQEIAALARPALRPTRFESPPDAPRAEPTAGAGGCIDHGSVPNVVLHSGEFHFSAVDLRIPGRGLDFIWARKYRSRLGPETAQGNGWDYSYDIRIERAGQALRLFDGNTRRDLYLPRPGGIYTARQFFREGKFELDGTFTLTFADAGTWNFHALDGAPAEGKIESIIDRNGNALQFQYDGLGRLAQVIDTLGRTVVIGYDGNGRIQTVTDFAGRVIRYSYYGAAEFGGSQGDLKTVATQAATGFPLGKTTTFTYSTGFADERLNHNLLTITDPAGQTWLANTYSSAPPGALGFDRVVRQRRGNPGEDIKIETELVTLSFASAQPLVRVIVNDCVGNVRESFFDRRGRLTLEREFTGRADPVLPTTGTTNRPTNPLRLDDPAYYDTLYSYNADSLVTRIDHPEGNVTRRVYELELDPLAGWRTRGNLRELRRTPGTHAPAGDQAELVELFEYETGFGGCCGVSFVKRHVDARGNETVHTYDSLGNRVHTAHPLPSIAEDWEYNSFGQVTAHVWPDNGSGWFRRDEFTYYGPSDGAQHGYLKNAIVDANGLALTTTYEYDAAGNIVRRIDPRGHDELRVVNPRNQVEAERSREWQDGSGIYHWRFYTYDANDNLIRSEIENRDENGILQANDRITTSWTHGILNEVLSETREIDAGSDAVTEYAYDANRNRTLVRYGEATSGAQPANTLTLQYDERNLLYRSIRAAGDPAQSTTQTDYDRNHNVRALRAGLEAGAHVTLYSYDGYDRLVSTTDPMGNVGELRYDANGNVGGEQSPGVPHVFGERILGELVDLPGSAGNVRLHQATYQYDAMDRRIQTSVQHFDSTTQAAIGDGVRLGQREWEDITLIGPVTRTRKDMLTWYMNTVRGDAAPHQEATWRDTDDHGHVHEYTYDGAGRRRTMLDPAGNTTTWTYDANGNVVALVEVDVSDLGYPDRTVTTSWAYDNLDRLIRHTDAGGGLTEYRYDSRGNRVVEIDPRGNITRYAYDGMDRLIVTDLTMTDNGTGSGTPIGSIVTAQTWDDSSRLTSQTDPDGNITQYDYDALDRRVRTINADGTQHSVTHDAHGDVVQASDPDGTVTTSTYDGLDRLLGTSIAPGPGVSNATTSESYQYDGLSRMVSAQDNDSSVLRRHDSLGDVLRETTQQLPGGAIRVVIAVYDALGNQTRLQYPGGRIVDRTYDELERAIVIRDVAPPVVLATSWYQGPTLERRDLGNGTRIDAYYDPARRPVFVAHAQIAGPVIVQRSSGWDPSSNRLNESDSFSGSHFYVYDSADRLIRSTAFPGSTTIDYLLDDAGDRTQVIGGPNPGPYTCVPLDCQRNRYTTTPADSLQYDANGNLTRRQTGPDVTTYVYDFRNRLVQATSSLSGSLGSYRYDCLDRCIERVLPSGTTRSLYDGAGEIEVRNVGGSVTATHVRGGTFDAPLFVRPVFVFVPRPELGVITTTRSAQKYYFHTDDQGSVIALTDASGVCVERYRYGDFGETTVTDAFGNPLSGSAVANDDQYRGRHRELHDVYSLQARLYSTSYGRWMQPDPLEGWIDAGLGNAYGWAGNNPVSTITLADLQDPPRQDPPSKPIEPVPIEIVSLSLVSANPMGRKGCGDKNTANGVTAYSPCYANSERSLRGTGKAHMSSAGFLADLDWQMNASTQCFLTCFSQACDGTQICLDHGHASTTKTFSYEDCALGWTGSPFHGGRPIMGWRVKVTSPPLTCRCRCW